MARKSSALARFSAELHGKGIVQTETIERVLLGHARRLMRGTVSRAGQPAAPPLPRDVEKGVEILMTVYETRSRAKMAPGNTPKKGSRYLNGAGSTNEAEEADSASPAPSSAESLAALKPRVWIGP